MPIRSETNSDGADGSSKLVMELKEIKLDVDPQIFVLPKQYQKVEYSRLVALIRNKDNK
jgi:hypothetical protein